MLALLRNSPILLLFVIAALGYLLGKVRVRGLGLGVAAVLFVGLAFGALDPAFKLPELVPSFGLVVFVYTVGLSSGPGFFSSLGKRGLGANLVVLGSLIVGALATVLIAKVAGLDGATASGLFCGALTNTPALAGVVDTLKSHEASEAVLSLPVVAYSIAYPLGVLGVLTVMAVIGRKSDAKDATPDHAVLQTVTVRIGGTEAVGHALGPLLASRNLRVVAPRIERHGTMGIADPSTVLEEGDLLSLVGPVSQVGKTATLLGEVAKERLDLDRNVLDFRRVMVSNPEVTGVPLSELHLAQRVGAAITRVRRGDIDLLAEDSLVLQLGDRVRFVAPRERMAEASKLFGDSDRAVAEVDVITFGLGVALGLLLGAVPIPLFGGQQMTLGIAGGPLIVGLVLGRLGRTGPLVWSMPLSANLTLRQLGLVLFLAGVGSRSGGAFVSTVRSGNGLSLIALGAVLTLLVATGAALALRRVLRMKVDEALGVIAGLHTQPAVLAFAVERAKGDQPNVSYASVYPLATIAKIILAQVLVAILR
jgi:putative transport protein